MSSIRDIDNVAKQIHDLQYHRELAVGINEIAELIRQRSVPMGVALRQAGHADLADELQIRIENPTSEHPVFKRINFPASFEYQYTNERFKTASLKGCARCGMDHGPMTWLPLYRPVVDPDGSKWTHWQMCPANGQPILMRSIKRDV